MSHSIAEAAFLGGIILAGEIPPEAETVSPADFQTQAHGKIFLAMVQLRDAGKPIDPLTVASIVGTETTPYLVQLEGDCPTAANVGHYAALVRAQSRVRDYRESLQGCLAKIDSEGDEAALETAAELTAIAEGGQTNKPTTMRRMLMPLIEEANGKGQAKPRLMTGFAALDAYLCGISPGDLIVLAGRPSMGKTALAMNILANVVRDSDACGIFLSYEMSAEGLGMRVLAAEAGVQLRTMRNGNATMDDNRRLARAAETLNNDRLFILDKLEATVAAARSACRVICARNNVKLIVVDYLQLMSGEGSNREQSVSSVSRGLKLLAGELGVPIIALSQLNRSLEQREDKRPRMSDLRESGAIEQDADTVIGVYRDEYYNGETDSNRGVAELGIMKQRQGPTGALTLKWNGKLTRFEN